MNAVRAGLVAERMGGAALGSAPVAADQSDTVPSTYVCRRYVEGLRHGGDDGRRQFRLVAGPSQTERGFMHAVPMLCGPLRWSQLHGAFSVPHTRLPPLHTGSLLYRSEHLCRLEPTRTDRYSQNTPRPASVESRTTGADCSPPSAVRLDSRQMLLRPPAEILGTTKRRLRAGRWPDGSALIGRETDPSHDRSTRPSVLADTIA
jgi:hypothetical protein